jgi:putative flippase GtrA
MNAFQTALFQKMLKFGIVGLSGMCIDFSLTWVFKEKIKLNKYIANTIGFSAAVINNFYLNYIWTFKGVHSSIPAAFGLFVLFAVIGLLLNNFFVYLFHGLGSLNFYISKGLAIIGVFIWNFASNYFFNFHK